VGVGHQAISLLWSSRAAGITLACLTSGPAFGTDFMQTSSRKLAFLGMVKILAAICLFAVPFMSSFSFLMTRKLVAVLVTLDLKPMQEPGLFERKWRRKLRSNFRRSGSEFIILRIPMSEKCPFWHYLDTEETKFFIQL
jgi:hypothetical protein